MEKILTKRNTILFVGAVTLWRACFSATLQLHPDEAYYWLWSRHLDFGYYDHSPLIAYFIRLTTLFSQAEFWVRFPGIIVTVVMSVVTWRLAMQLFGRVAVAAGSVILLNTYPLTMTGSLIITPDIPAFLFWSLAVYFFWQIVRTQKTAYWYVFGAMFGLALLSKYTAVLLAPFLFLFMLMTDERRWLKTVHPYLSMLLAFVFFLPVVYWNVSHDWISFRFQLGHGLGGQSYSLARVAEYAGGQLLVAGPLVWLLGMDAVSVYLFSRDKGKLFLSLTSLPVILFFAYSSLKKLAGPNWPALAYFTFSIAAGKFLLEGMKLRRSLWTSAVLINIGLSMLVMLYAKFNIIPLPRINEEWAVADATNWFYGWRELGEEIRKHPDIRFVLTPSHQLSAAVIYYTGEKIPVHVDEKITRPSQFNLWPFPDGSNGADGLYVYVEGSACGPFHEYFARTDESSSLTILRQDFPIRVYRIARGHGYLPVPPASAAVQ